MTPYTEPPEVTRAADRLHRIRSGDGLIAVYEKHGDMPGRELDKWMLDRAEVADAYPALKADRDRLRQANADLHRRCQHAESAARETVERVARAGPSIGRALSGWAAEDRRRQLEAMTADRDRLLSMVEDMRKTLENVE